MVKKKIEKYGTGLKFFGGEFLEIHYDDKVKELDFDLARDSIGSPLIVVSDVSSGKVLLRLHIKEALEVKAIFDKLVLDYVEWKQEGDW